MKMLFLKYLEREFVWFRDFKTQILWSVWKEKQNNTLKKCKKQVRSSDNSTWKRNHQDQREIKVLRKKWVLEL